jgi:NADP-dependent 3-hydroxy acid dehydrogenase YdfG
MPGAARPLDGKVALVTGASSGIGEATAVALAEAGAAVAIGARRKDRLDALSARLRKTGASVLQLELDVTEEAACADAVRRTREELGGLDALVNNAGVMLLGPVEGADTADWRRMIDVNLLGLLYCTHAALPLMREAGRGHIVNVSSVAGRSANAGSAVYNLTKFGVGAFSEALRQEVSSAGIRVTIIEPGFVDTELQGHNEGPVLEAIEKMRESMPEVLVADDIASAIQYAVTRPQRMDVNEVLIRPTGQRR